MGRMLEALMHLDGHAIATEPEAAALCPEPEPASEASEEQMPFVEVGGPRKAAEPKPHLAFPGPRPATLRVQPAANVRLQACSKSSPGVAGELIAFHQPEHAVSQQYAALFSQLAPEASDGPAAVLLLTALAPGGGTTTALLNLAVSGCRQHQRRIVVVDANRTRPAAAQRLGLQSKVGLHDVLQGRAALEQALLATPQSDLLVLSAGAADGPSWPADALRWVVAWLQPRCDLILVDAPAWGDSAELRALTPLADAVYLVVDAVEAQQPQVRAVTRAVMQQGGRVGGLIVTQ